MVLPRSTLVRVPLLAVKKRVRARSRGFSKSAKFRTLEISQICGTHRGPDGGEEGAHHVVQDLLEGGCPGWKRDVQFEIGCDAVDIRDEYLANSVPFSAGTRIFRGVRQHIFNE
jgi:hypothetical protein